LGDRLILPRNKSFAEGNRRLASDFRLIAISVERNRTVIRLFVQEVCRARVKLPGFLLFFAPFQLDLPKESFKVEILRFTVRQKGKPQPIMPPSLKRILRLTRVANATAIFRLIRSETLFATAQL